jgi:CheY-like chemotaxis protein
VARVALVHWNAAEAAERVERLRGAGFDAEALSEVGPGVLRALAAEPPDAIAIDLTRLPSHGGAVGTALRQRKGTRAIPLLFIEGDAGKAARIRALLPDAAFTTWAGVAEAVREALKRPPAAPVVPGAFDVYSGTPLLKKLRIGVGTAVALLNAPEGFEGKLAPLQEGARLVKTARAATVTLLFVTSAGETERRIAALARQLREGQTLWVAWPKKTSAKPAGIGQLEVRRLGLAAGIVDYKICAIDETWSGLAFAVRRKR